MLFPIGSLVQLKTGGPVMEVVGHMLSPEVKLSCEWVNEALHWDNGWFRPSEVNVIQR